MSAVLFITYTIILAALFGYSIYQVVVKDRLWFILIFFAFYLTTYTTLQSLAYQHTYNVLIVKGLQSIKELVVLIAVGVLVVTHRNIFTTRYKLYSTDKIYLIFLAICILYTFLPLGAAGLVTKLLYLKNILLPAFMYYLGRNMVLGDAEQKKLLNSILIILAAAFFINLIESSIGAHFHSFVGYGVYNDDVNEVEPTGHFNLSWTFETSAGKPRYGAFFANPLELSSFVLIAFATAFILFIKTPHKKNQGLYLLFIFLVIGCTYFAFSRASMMALFMQVVFIAFLFKYYRILWVGLASLITVVIYIAYFASDELRYFVIDTLTFQNPSSLGHAIEWLEGIESMISNPLGIGIAMSGNAGSVEGDLKVGGENQFIIYGVQLGVFGMLVYISLLVSAIRKSLNAYRYSIRAEDQLIPFIAATTKFGLILPLFTANAELYLYISYVSWWMVGYSINTLRSSEKAYKFDGVKA